MSTAGMSFSRRLVIDWVADWYGITPDKELGKGWARGPQKDNFKVLKLDNRCCFTARITLTIFGTDEGKIQVNEKVFHSVNIGCLNLLS